MVRFYLERERWAVLVVGEGPAGEAAFHRERPHLAILNIMLPGPSAPVPGASRGAGSGRTFDGLELCRRIRQHSTIPILSKSQASRGTLLAIVQFSSLTIL
jgi:DNA-binding response OmpR family regulator